MKNDGGASFTDMEMIDFLEEMLAEKRYTGRVIVRWSFTGRGMRLHETGIEGAAGSIREAISNAILKAREK